MEKSILPKLKRDSKLPKISRSSIFRLDTLGAVNNLINQKTFLEDLKKKMKSNEKPKNKFQISSNSPNKKVMFSVDSSPEMIYRNFRNEGPNQTFNPIDSYDTKTCKFL